MADFDSPYLNHMKNLWKIPEVFHHLHVFDRPWAVHLPPALRSALEPSLGAAVAVVLRWMDSTTWPEKRSDRSGGGFFGGFWSWKNERFEHQNYGVYGVYQPAQTLVKTIQTYTDFNEFLFDHRKMGTLAWQILVLHGFTIINLDFANNESTF